MGTNGETSNPDQKKQECCIYKVHNGLRKAKPEAYTPMLVSIGPYHRKNLDLVAMQEYKMRYKTSLLDRGNLKEESCEVKSGELLGTEESCKVKLEELLEKARECYADLINLEYNDNDFVEMMMLDGCFIIGFLFDSNNIINVDWMRRQIYRDLMLLENQLPYFVLAGLYDTIFDRSKQISLWEKVMLAFNFMLPKPRRFTFISDGQDFSDKIKHLLHLVDVFCHYDCLRDKIHKNCVCEQLRQSVPEQPINTRRNVDPLRVPFLLPQQSTEISNSNGNRNKDQKSTTENCTGVQVLKRIGSVVELQEAGVAFKKIGEVYNDFPDLTRKVESPPDDVSLFRIKFEDCCSSCFMRVPSFKIEDSTESLFRNLIAYEQHSSDDNRKYFTDFITLMDQLINSGKDVKILRRKGIIVNLLGDDETVSCLFNELNKGVIESYESNYAYSGLRQKVNDHCEKKMNTLRATLVRDYLSTPCLTASTFAAVLLLILAIAQTVIAFITLFE